MTHTLPPEFAPVYRYTVRDGAVTDAAVLNRELFESPCTVYAHVAGDAVLYIGKSEGTLSARIAKHIRYMRSRKPPAGPFAEFTEGKPVTTYAMRAPTVTVCGLPVCVTASLEQALIRKFKPPFVYKGA